MCYNDRRYNIYVKKTASLVADWTIARATRSKLGCSWRTSLLVLDYMQETVRVDAANTTQVDNNAPAREHENRQRHRVMESLHPMRHIAQIAMLNLAAIAE